MAELKPCPICGHNAKRVSNFNKRKRISSRIEYGIVCSNSHCGWSYAWAAYSSLESAEKHWNQRVDEKLYLLERSKELLPCSCGRQPSLICERYRPLNNMWFVECPSCKKLTTGVESIDQATTEWNKRRQEDDRASATS